MDKKIHKRKHDQEKHNHREEFKGHKTRKHYISTVREEEATEEIKDVTQRGEKT